jgi:hypothetical protein
LKLENMLVRKKNGEPVLIDFGISKAASAATMTQVGITVGTLKHMPPERLDAAMERRKDDYQPTADIYSLGYMLFESLTGWGPYKSISRGKTEVEIIQAVLTEQPRNPWTPDLTPWLPEALGELALGMLAKKPADRPQTAREVQLALETLLKSADESWDKVALTGGRPPVPVEPSLVAPAPPPLPLPVGAGGTGAEPLPSGLSATGVPVTKAARVGDSKPPLGTGAGVSKQSLPPAPPPSVGSVGIDAAHAVEGPQVDLGHVEGELVASAEAALPAIELRASSQRLAVAKAMEPEPQAAVEMALLNQDVPPLEQQEVQESRNVSQFRMPAGAAHGEGSQAKRMPSGPKSAAYFVHPDGGVGAQSAAVEAAKEPKQPTALKNIDRLAERMRHQGPPAHVTAANQQRIAAVAMLGVMAVAALWFMGTSHSGARSSAKTVAVDPVLEQYASGRASQVPLEVVVATQQASLVAAPVQSLPAPPQTVATVTLPDAKEPVRPSKARSDAAAVDAIALENYSKNRPTLSADGKDASSSSSTVHKAKAPMPSWLKTGVPIAEATTKANDKLGVSYGTHIHMTLKSNLDSRTTQHGVVEAVLSRAVMVNGEVVLPARTLVFGKASPTEDRFLLELTRLRLPDGTEVMFKASGLDREDGKPGLMATSRIGSDGTTTSTNVGGQMASTAAQGALGLAGAALGPVGSVATQTAGTGVSAATMGGGGSNSASNGRSAILLPGGVSFDAVVLEGF